MSPCSDPASSTPSSQVPGSGPAWAAVRRAAARLPGAAAPAGEEERPGSQLLPSFINPRAWPVAAALPCLPHHVSGRPLTGRRPQEGLRESRSRPDLQLQL